MNGVNEWGIFEVKKKAYTAWVAIVMGSHSDLPVMQTATGILKKFKIPFQISILSAHRTPEAASQFAQLARCRGIRVIIAGAGGAAHLAGMLAAYTELPVIGVPIPSGPLQGLDSLLSTVQMPRGVPVATVAIGNAWNAGVLAAQILGAALPQEKGGEILNRVRKYKDEMEVEVSRKNRTENKAAAS